MTEGDGRALVEFTAAGGGHIFLKKTGNGKARRRAVASDQTTPAGRAATSGHPRPRFRGGYPQRESGAGGGAPQKGAPATRAPGGRAKTVAPQAFWGDLLPRR